MKMDSFPIQTKRLHVHLPQTKDVSNDKQYLLFKKRAEYHSQNGFAPDVVHRSQKKEMMEIFMDGTVTGSSMTHLIVNRSSFQLLEDNGIELGFTLIVKTIIVEVEYKLVVLKDAHKAYLERTDTALPDMPQTKVLFMHLPQFPDFDNDTDYKNFEKRTKKHSDNLYVDGGEDLESMRFHFKGSQFNSVTELRLVRKSFENTKNGFIAIVKTIVDEVEFRLEVFKEQHTARLVRVMK